VTIFDGIPRTGDDDAPGANWLRRIARLRRLVRIGVTDMTEPAPPPDPTDPGDPSAAALVAALSLRLPQLQSLIASHPQYREGDLLPYLLLAECYRWLTAHVAQVAAHDPEAEAIRQLCGELFSIIFEHDALGAAFAIEMLEAMLAGDELGR
jgi:hypothetical protein